MMSDVPEATVVVTNPTHYAVALKYDRTVGVEQGAPRCVAKGVDEVAQKIKEIANAHDVPLFEDVPLARGLYANVEIGDEIPEDFFQAVATVLGSKILGSIYYPLQGFRLVIVEEDGHGQQAAGGVHQ